MTKKDFTGFAFRIAVVVIGCVVAASAASAFEGRGRHHGGKGADCGFGFLKQLDLTDAQKSGIAEIMERFDPPIDALRTEIHQARQQMQTALREAPFNEAQVRAAYREISPLNEDIFVLRARMKSEIRSQLTEDQVKALEERRADWCEMGLERRAHRQTMMKKCLQMDADETP